MRSWLVKAMDSMITGICIMAAFIVGIGAAVLAFSKYLIPKWRREEEAETARRVAAMKAADEKLEVKGAVMASDAFFPFRDGLDVAAEYGIAAVIQPGGSLRDAEVIAAADEHGMTMVFTGMRHFRH